MLIWIYFVLSLLSACEICFSQLFSVLEEQPPKTFVANLAVDGLIRNSTGDKLDLRKRLALSYRLLDDGSTRTAKFIVLLDSGILLTGQRFDRETICPTYQRCMIPLDVVAYSETDDFYHIFRVTIEIEDINDHPPSFNNKESELSIPESVEVGSEYELPGAIDQDFGNNSKLDYQISPNISEFTLNIVYGIPDTLSLVILQDLDREVQDTYTLMIVASDRGVKVLQGSTTVVVRLTDINDCRPVFSQDIYDVKLKENTPVGSLVVNTLARDDDMGENAKIKYSLAFTVREDIQNLISIDGETGRIIITSELDYEKFRNVEFSIECADFGTPSLSSRALVRIAVTNENDNVPQINFNFLSDSKYNVIEEGFYSNKFIAHVSVVDRDVDSPDEVVCEIEPHIEGFLMQKIFGDKYQIILTKELDREIVDKYNLTVCCNDKGDPPLINCSGFVLHVTDVNDNPPHFKNTTYRVRVPEGYTGILVDLNVTDLDAGRNGEISVKWAADRANTSGYFTVVNENYFTAVTALDREDLSSDVRISLLAEDAGSPRKTATALIVLTIDDINDETPHFEKSHYIYHLEEHSPRNLLLDKIHASDYDADRNGKLTYSLNIDNALFYIKPNSGELFVNKSLDRERTSEYRFQVIAKDHGNPPLSNTANISIFVTDINDHSPQFIFPLTSNYEVVVDKPVKKGDLVALVTAVDPDLGVNGTILYSINNQPYLFEINEHTGKVKCKKDLQEMPRVGLYLNITASDEGTPSRQTSTRMKIYLNSTIQSEDNLKFTWNVPHATIVVIVCVLLFLFIVIIGVVWFLCKKRTRITQQEQSAKYNAWSVAPTQSNHSVAYFTNVSSTQSSDSGNSSNGSLVININMDREKQSKYLDQETSSTDGSRTLILKSPDSDRCFDVSCDNSINSDSGRGASEEDSHEVNSEKQHHCQQPQRRSLRTFKHNDRKRSSLDSHCKAFLPTSFSLSGLHFPYTSLNKHLSFAVHKNSPNTISVSQNTNIGNFTNATDIAQRRVPHECTSYLDRHRDSIRFTHTGKTSSNVTPCLSIDSHPTYFHSHDQPMNTQHGPLISFVNSRSTSFTSAINPQFYDGHPRPSKAVSFSCDAKSPHHPESLRGHSTRTNLRSGKRPAINYKSHDNKVCSTVDETFTERLKSLIVTEEQLGSDV